MPKDSPENYKRTIEKGIVETVREPLIVLDADLKVISANKSFYRSFKVNPKETQGRLIYDLGNRQWNIPKLRKLLEEILPKSTTIENYEVEHDFKTIGPKRMLLNARRIESTQMILLAIEDITERKKVEQITAEKMKLESYIEGMSDGVVILNLKGGVIDVNKSYSRMSGREKGEVVGKLAFSVGDLPKKEFLGALSMIKEIIQKGSIENRELTLLNKEKKEVSILFSAALIKDSRGKPESIFAVFKDITERKRTEEALRRSEAHLKEAQSLGRIGSWEFDVEKQTIVWSEETYGLYERDPKLGPPSPEEEARYYSAEQAKTLRDYAARAIETGKKFSYDLTAKLPSGRTVYLAATMRPVKDERGRVVKLFGTVQDITNRKIKEEELRKRTEESERFSKLSVGRELKMVELKKRISELENQIKEKPK
jgi:PAS domain S-box-containing protein